MVEATALKLPPHSLEAEQSVIGGLLIDNDAWDAVASMLVANDFYRADHRNIFTAITALVEDNQPCDAITVSEWLKQKGLLAEAGGLPYLGQLAQDIPSASNIRAYAGIVREKATLRELIHAGTYISDIGFAPDGRKPDELIETAEQKVFSIADRRNRSQQGFHPIGGVMARTVKHIEEMFEAGSSITGLPTGLVDFDNITSGLHGGDLVIIAGRPSMGKTSFAMNLVENICVTGKHSTAVFSMEMPAEQLAMRMISSMGKVDQQRLRNGKLSEQDWRRVASTVKILSGAPLHIDDSAALSPSEVRARARRLKRSSDLALIVVDYLQLMQVPGTRENRTTEVSEISRGLKSLAKELNVPVLALSQLNRAVEKRPDQRPAMSDLRESGAIEQDADMIVFVHREEVLKPETERKGIADIIIAKQRNGPIGDIQTAFVGKHTRFENLVPDYQQYEPYDSP